MEGVRSAFIGLIEIADAARVQAYEDWHATDHLPENLALPGVVYANRWIALPEHAARRVVHDPALARAQFLITYFFCEPVDDALAEWNALAERLAAMERMFGGRDVRLGGIFDLVDASVSPGVEISPEALPHRRHRGAYVRVARSSEADSADEARHRATLSCPGVLGGYRFASRGTQEYGSASGGRADLYFLDDEPLDVLAKLDPGAADPDCLVAGVFRKA